MTLDGHHLFDKVNRPDLADFSTIFLLLNHQFMLISIPGKVGGCEPKDFQI